MSVDLDIRLGALDRTDLEALATAAALQLHSRQLSAFPAGGHHHRGGDRWPEWSPRYAARQEKRGRTVMMIDTGRLRQSITSDGSYDGDALEIAVATDTPYARVHQDGGSTMPRRRVFQITDQDRAFVNDFLAAGLSQILDPGRA